MFYLIQIITISPHLLKRGLAAGASGASHQLLGPITERLHPSLGATSTGAEGFEGWVIFGWKDVGKMWENGLRNGWGETSWRGLMYLDVHLRKFSCCETGVVLRVSLVRSLTTAEASAGGSLVPRCQDFKMDDWEGRTMWFKHVQTPAVRQF